MDGGWRSTGSGTTSSRACAALDEFRPPFGVIGVSSEVLQRYDDRLAPTQRAEQLDAMVEHVRRMAGMLEDALVLTRLRR